MLFGAWYKFVCVVMCKDNIAQCVCRKWIKKTTLQYVLFFNPVCCCRKVLFFIPKVYLSLLLKTNEGSTHNLKKPITLLYLPITSADASFIFSH